MSDKMWYEITYPFRNLNGCNAEVSEWMINFVPHFIIDLIMLGLKLIHVNDRAHGNIYIYHNV